MAEEDQVQREQPRTIHQILQFHAEKQPEAIAIASPGRSPLSYAELHDHTCHVVETLNTMNICRNDRVAIVLPNGPEMAVTFLSVASAASSAPLNPAYRARDYDFYLSDLNAKALITLSGFDTPAIAVAEKHGIPIIELIPSLNAQAGLFELKGDTRLQTAQDGFARPEDVALVLNTSGTTSRPKMVPLKHLNICRSAQNIHRTLALTKEDRCLNIMPLFHIHGLIGATLSSIHAGASIICTPGFHAERFFEWIASLRPTWYSAVPTIHQAILGQVNANKDIIDANPLRFIRSSSASLPPQVMAELEEAFHAPVIESYGMTEASHQMTSNPLPPLKRKSGSVGLPAGPEVTIMDQDGNIKTTGKRGEIVIRGENVMQGYENNPEANRAAFTEGWFRTGDEGYFDSDGYLHISGRIKEIINRGGEKITPREVDEALLEHHAVAQAVTFAVPHPSLGEDVAAAVVLQQDATVSEKDLRDFAFNRLADFKVPSQIILVENIPKGPTGKLQRIGLAKRMELELQPQYVEPKSDTQRILATLMADVLKVERVGILDNFFALGGDSLLAMSFFSRIENEMERKLPLAALFQAPTVEQLAAKLEDVSWSAPWSSLVPIQSTGTRPPFFFIHAHGGNVVTYYHLAQHLDSDQPFYGLQAQALKNRVITHHRIEEMAAHYIKEIRTVQPTGPYYLGGWCMGGCIAYEMAQQLLPQGEKIALLAMVQSSHPDYPKYRKGTTSFHRLIYQALQRIDLEVSNLLEISGIRAKLVHLKNRSNGLFTTLQVSLERSLEQILGLLNIKLPHSRSYILKEIEKAHTLSYDTYEPKSYTGSAVIFYTKKQPMGIHPDNSLGWRELIKGELKLEEIPGHRIGMLTEPRVRFLAQRLQDCIDHAMTKNTT